MEWAPVPGTVLLGKYRIESVLGRGGMGIVLRVTHLHLGEELALKILSPEAAGGPDVHARFLREAQSAARLRGEHVTRVSDVGIFPEGAPYIVMEYLRGIDLSGELERRQTLAPGDIVDYVLQVCEALAEAHALGIVHRDIKPSNLFLTSRPDGTPLVKVLDFGISKAPVSSGVLTRTEAVMGTPGYMSPEQMKAARDVDARTDIWALGIVLYECLNGRRPFDAESFSAAVLRAATEPPPPMAPWIPRGLQAAVLHCLEKDRAARFPSVVELAAALSPFARDRRAAAIIVERTTAMLRGSSRAAVVGTRSDQAPDATTLSGSAGVVRSRSPRQWYAMGGAVLVVGTIAVVLAVIQSGSSRSDDANAGPAVRDAGPAHDLVAGTDKANAAFDSRSASDGRSAITAIDAGVAGPKESALPERPAASPAPVGASGPAASSAPVGASEPAVSSAPVGASGPAASSAPGRAEHGPDLEEARCAELEVRKDWQGLATCASQLAAMGAQSKAEELRAKAVKESASSRAAALVESALRKGDLRKAQKQLNTIRTDSVYFATAKKAFQAAEAKSIAETTQEAQKLANANDCTGLAHFQTELSSRSTSSVIAAAGAVTCVAPKPSAQAATVDGALWSSLSDDGRGASPSEAKNRCRTIDVDDLMKQAENQDAAGFPKTALSIVRRVLDCKQDARMYRMAATYACAARDAANAKRYFSMVPRQSQDAIVQRCRQQGIALRAQ